MTEEECEQLFQGHEDAQGNIHYEGRSIYRWNIKSHYRDQFQCMFNYNGNRPQDDVVAE